MTKTGNKNFKEIIFALRKERWKPICFLPQGLWDLSSATRDWTHALEVKAQSLNYWMARQFPKTNLILVFCIWKAFMYMKTIYFSSSPLRTEKEEIYLESNLQNTGLGSFPMIQWLILCAFNAGGPGSIPDQGTRSHMP